MCKQCNEMANVAGKKRKKSRVSGMDSGGMIRFAKKMGAGAAGFVVGEYASKMIQDSTTDKTKLPNAGVVGIGKVVIAGVTAAYVENEYVQDMCVGVAISGVKDIAIANAAEFAQSAGLHGIDYGTNGNWANDYPPYDPNAAGGSYAGASTNAAGNSAKVAY
jgi:hypothetical protein